jgi:hypothetical protein
MLRDLHPPHIGDANALAFLGDKPVANGRDVAAKLHQQRALVLPPPPAPTNLRLRDAVLDVAMQRRTPDSQ